MSLYDEVLNCPDTHCRKEALDKLCKEKIVEGMEIAAIAVVVNGVGTIDGYMERKYSARIRKAAKDLEDS